MQQIKATKRSASYASLRLRVETCKSARQKLKVSGFPLTPPPTTIIEFDIEAHILQHPHPKITHVQITVSFTPHWLHGLLESACEVTARSVFRSRVEVELTLLFTQCYRTEAHMDAYKEDIQSKPAHHDLVSDHEAAQSHHDNFDSKDQRYNLLHPTSLVARCSRLIAMKYTDRHWGLLETVTDRLRRS